MYSYCFSCQQRRMLNVALKMCAACIDAWYAGTYPVRRAIIRAIGSELRPAAPARPVRVEMNP